MIRRPEQQLAAMVLHGRIPAGPEPTPDAIDWAGSTWHADAYLDDLDQVCLRDPWCADVIATVTELRRLGRPADPTTVHQVLTARSDHHHERDCTRLATLDWAPYPLAGIPAALDAITRDDLREQLVAMVGELDTPGSAQRITANLRAAAA